MADYNILAVLATGKPGLVNASNYGVLAKLKVGSVDFAAHASQHQHSGADEVATATPGANAIPKADASGNLAAGWGAAANTLATLDGSVKVVQQPASISDFLESAPSNGESGKAPDSNWAYDHENGADPHDVYSLAAGTRAFTGTVSGVTPTSTAHLTTKGYVDGLVQGLKSFLSVVARTTGNISIAAPGATIDGVTMSVDDRVLVDQQSTGSEDGIYLWKGAATPMVRTADAPTGTAFAAAYLFVQEGTENADTGFVCTNDGGADVIGTHDIVMTEFSRAASYTGGDGIDVTTTVISVDLDASIPGMEFASNKLRVKAKTAAGIEVDASGVAINIEASDPSLQFASNELGVKFTAAGGLQKSASGTEIKLSGTTLQLAAGGASVNGLPSLFEINTTAVGATVTAANLDEVTDGSETTLHSHAAVSSHAIGGSSHSASTLANLNSKISDLIATYGAVRDVGCGTIAQRPSAGAAGRFWWATDTDTLSYDNGATWDEIVASPGAHAASHKHGGGDEVAQTASAANAIPKGDGSGKLAVAWLSEVLAYSDLTDDPIGTHEGESDPHTGYRLESADHSHESTGAQAGKIDHGAALDGLTDNDHTQYILHSLATAANDFLVASGSGAFAKKTLAEVGTLLEGDIEHGELQGLADDDHSQYHNDARAVTWHDADDHSGFKDDDVTWTGEHTFDAVIGNGDYVGFQIPRTVGTGGITAADLLKFDPSGQIVRRSDPDDPIAGIAAANAAASATGYYIPIGVAKALFTSGKEPTSAGQNVFNDNTAGNYHKLTTDVQTNGIVYSFVALETGALAQVMVIPRRLFSFEN